MTPNSSGSGSVFAQATFFLINLDWFFDEANLMLMQLAARYRAILVRWLNEIGEREEAFRLIVS